MLPDVFHPAWFRTSDLLADVLLGEHLADLRALDLGTGSGIGAICAAKRGARVVAVDLNPQAVRCARLNAALHGLDDVIEARGGDLFAPVSGERFDIIIFNPPFFRGTPQDRWDLAWRGTDVLERFAAGLGERLEPGGRAILVLSTAGACGDLLADLRGRGFRAEVLAERRFREEIVTVWELRMIGGAPPWPSPQEAKADPSGSASPTARSRIM